jgi:hypothetical protein
MSEQIKVSRPDAAGELLKRRELRGNLLSWAKYFSLEYNQTPAQHHLLLLEKLQQITDGTLIHSKTGLPCRRLMVLMPPGSAKSRYTSVIFPPWFIQRREHCDILAFSCTAELIERFSRECRNTVAKHSRVLGYGLTKDSKSVQEWSTSNGGRYRCAGVGAQTTGRRAHCGIIDDYIGSQEDADSKLVRDKQWEWYDNDFWPRLFPDAIQIIVANRRHEDDLVGRLLEREGDRWEVCTLPFFAEANDILGRKVGERLWPEWFTEEMAQDISRKPPRTIAGLYQQRPAPEEGNYFKSEWCLTYNQSEYEQLMALSPRIYGAGDWAVSEAKDANQSCFGGGALHYDGTLYILPDLFWEAAGPKKVVSAYVNFLKRHNPLQFWSEKGHISKSWGPFLREMMEGENVYNYITEVNPARDKEVRAQSIRGRMSMFKVKFPSFAPWWEKALHELLTFPGGKSDDFVDFISHLGMGILNMQRASKPKEVEVEDIYKTQPITLAWMKSQDKMQRRAMQPKYQGR